MTTPNPGSDAAVALGCVCGRTDNHYGRGIPWPREDGRDPTEFPCFWVNQDCPLHGAANERRNP